MTSDLDRYLAQLHTLLTQAMESCPDCDELDQAEELLDQLRTAVANGKVQA